MLFMQFIPDMNYNWSPYLRNLALTTCLLQ